MRLKCSTVFLSCAVLRVGCGSVGVSGQGSNRGGGGGGNVSIPFFTSLKTPAPPEVDASESGALSRAKTVRLSPRG